MIYAALKSVKDILVDTLPHHSQVIAIFSSTGVIRLRAKVYKTPYFIQVQLSEHKSIVVASCSVRNDIDEVYSIGLTSDTVDVDIHAAYDWIIAQRKMIHRRLFHVTYDSTEIDSISRDISDTINNAMDLNTHCDGFGNFLGKISIDIKHDMQAKITNDGIIDVPDEWLEEEIPF